MDIYDKNSRCLMTEGEYELLLSEDQHLTNGDAAPKKNGSWENVSKTYSRLDTKQSTYWGGCCFFSDYFELLGYF